ncbi:PAS and ANTAR domain-containing protein [Luteimicrobium sp. NPDC057192]|uniref:PAS and ANTAR domain-containing protein n=1 Tax=Luteimicrobium sp. NPDC057192 TaxID=3346042 RepID=UPI003639C4BF
MGLAHAWAADDGAVPAAGVDDAVSREPAPRGRFAYELETDTWWWSDGTYRLHGFEPGEVVPTTRLVLAHKHPDDRERFRALFAAGCRSGEPFVSLHRIMAASGDMKDVVLAAQAVRDEHGEVARLVGSFLDVTAVLAARAAEVVDESVRRAAESRATIDQAKGILGASWRISPDDAFERLRRASMRTNVPVRELAAQVVRRACAPQDEPGPGPRLDD